MSRVSLADKDAGMDRLVEYTMTTHDLYHYFTIDGWENFRWHKVWDGHRETQSVEKLIGDEWVRVGDSRESEYMRLFKRLFYESELD